MLTVRGLASQKIVAQLNIPEDFPSELSLMKFLTDNRITIASSCSGVGTCHKCVVNKTILSCQITLIEFLEKYPTAVVEIAYL